MKVGDLVRHPLGMANVCKDAYSFGLILEVEEVGPPYNRVIQHLVWWCDDYGPMCYIEDNLELISESR